jgi:hypothetical protein
LRSVPLRELLGMACALMNSFHELRRMLRGKFAFQVIGEHAEVFELACSEWHLFRRLRSISAAGVQLAYFESAGCPLEPRSLAALNLYLRSGAIRAWGSARVCRSSGRELIGVGEWRSFCRMLSLKFEGKGVRQAVA